MITPEQIDKIIELLDRFVTAFEYEMTEPGEQDDDQADFAFIPDGPLDS